MKHITGLYDVNSETVIANSLDMSIIHIALIFVMEQKAYRR